MIIENPYLEKTEIRLVWNPNYDQYAICECGHFYHEHFDSYDKMEPAGCSECYCYKFEKNQ